MLRIVIGAALAATLIASAACSGTSSTSPSPASPSSSTSAFPAQAFSAQASSWAGVLSGTLSSHDHAGTEGDDHGREGQLEGAIASIDTAHQSFVVRTTTVTVSASTVIRRGDTTLAFADLTVGAHVHVKGTPAGASIAAADVIVQGEERDAAGAREANGLVSGLTGACPALTFTLGSTTVTTTAATEFRNGGCAQVINGVRVEVRGATQADGSVAASRVSLSHEGNEKDDSD